MVTKSEKKVIEDYKERGYFHVHSGAPDFIFYKLKQFKATQDKTIQGKTNLKNTNQNKPIQNHSIPTQINPCPTVEDIDISTIKFVEVKFNGDVLHHEQQIWKHILEQLGLDYKLIHIHSLKQTTSNPPKATQERTIHIKTKQNQSPQNQKEVKRNGT